MALYVQAANSDTWHWCTNCSHYPQTVAKSTEQRPSWDLCEQCKEKEKNGTCSS